MDIATQLHALFSVHGLVSLVTLTLLELILGIDNIIFISLVIARLPEGNRLTARVVGLSLALLMRFAMLFCLVWLSQTTSVLFTIGSFNATVRDVLFFSGGCYLVWSTARELRTHLKKEEAKDESTSQLVFKKAIAQIVMVDVLFSFDSIFTAIGLIQNLVVMAAAVTLGMVFMLWLSGSISRFINKYPSVKRLALTFIIAVGLLLVLSAFHIEIPKKHIYLIFCGMFAYEMGSIMTKKSK